VNVAHWITVEVFVTINVFGEMSEKFENKVGIGDAKRVQAEKEARLRSDIGKGFKCHVT